MKINVTILNVSILTTPTKTGGTYQTADVAYKNNTFAGKVEGKKIVSFGATAESFKKLATAQPGDTFDVEIIKNTGGYNDWITLEKASVVQGSVDAGSGPSVRSSGVQTSVRSTYETSEERVVRQRSIVRQSSLSNAVNTLAVGAKKLDPAEVIDVAKQYEAYVHSAEIFSGGATGFDDVPSFDKDFQPS